MLLHLKFPAFLNSSSESGEISTKREVRKLNWLPQRLTVKMFRKKRSNEMKTSKRHLRKIVSSVICCSFLICTAAAGLSASAYGPSTLYTPSSSAPSPGALYARAMQASDGSMYATFEQYSSGTPVFPIYKSTNNGQTFTQVGSVNDTQHGYGMRYQPFLYELPQAIGNMPEGTLLCAGNCIPNDLSTTEIDLYKSTDSGVSWTYVSTIATGGRADPNGQNDPVWEPFLLVANNKLICYYSDETDSAHNQKIVHKTTTNGTAWSSLVEDVALEDSSLRPGMPVVAKLQNNNYIMTYEIVGESGNPCKYKISSNPESFSPSNEGTQFGSGGSPYCAVMPNGRLVAGTYGTGNVYVNNNNGTGSWYYVSSKLGAAYSRCLVPLANGRLFIISGGGFGGSNNSVTYCDMDIGSMSQTKVELSLYNNSNYYIRHYNYEAVLNSNVSPVEDMQFRVVPGLADSNSVSFESVNFPGYYLRHYDYKLYVNQNDDSAVFAKDATFKRVRGLGNSNGYSYQSNNFPSKYIMVDNNVLYIKDVSTTADKNNATFRETSVS